MPVRCNHAACTDGLAHDCSKHTGFTDLPQSCAKPFITIPDQLMDALFFHKLLTIVILHKPWLWQMYQIYPAPNSQKTFYISPSQMHYMVSTMSQSVNTIFLQWLVIQSWNGSLLNCDKDTTLTLHYISAWTGRFLLNFYIDQVPYFNSIWLSSHQKIF